MEFKTHKEKIEDSYKRRIKQLSYDLNNLRKDYELFKELKNNSKFQIIKVNNYIYTWRCDLILSKINHYLIY